MIKLAPFELCGYELDRPAAVVLLELWLYSKRPEYNGGIVQSNIDNMAARRLFLTLPAKQFITHWFSALVRERKRAEAVERLIELGLLQKVQSIQHGQAVYYGVKLTRIGDGLAEKVRGLLPERIAHNRFRAVCDLIARFRKCRKAEAKTGLFTELERLKTAT